MRQTLSSSSLNYHTLCKVESHKDWIDHGQTDHAHFLLASLQFDQIELDIDYKIMLEWKKTFYRRIIIKKRHEQGEKTKKNYNRTIGAYFFFYVFI